MYCSIKLHTTDQTTPHPSYFLQKSWNFGNMEVFTCLQHCISLQWAVVHEEDLSPTLCHTHAYQSPCSIIEICIIHESFKSIQSTCDSQTLPLSCPPHKMPAVQLPTVWLPAEEEARVHPSDPSNIHMKKSRRVEVLQTARISPG